MNLLLFSASDRVEANRITVSDARLQHIRTVLSASEGDTLRVGEIDGEMGTATLLEIGAEAALLEVSLEQAPPAKLPLCLVLALPRPKMLRRILRNVAELGVAELHLINSHRVEKSYWQSPALEPATVREYFLEGLSQSRDTVLPQLQLHKRFKPYVEDKLPALLAERRALVAHPGDYPACPVGCETPTTLFIGPEGGFIPYEIDKLLAAGCEAVSLGPRILRVENAVTSLVARMST
jgi:RsmE family RNA methyltransferase